ncbi:hypothetical protein C370_07253 [Cryptococcus neoformans A1-35-8]|nr:hypothetical protein C370_07253 [Cryptococcus neoformans var. grubii A1-35-8]OXH12325.1 hypothetical protein C369_02816 [Cryptococcus neoformans var. grubii A5-35-17]
MGQHISSGGRRRVVPNDGGVAQAQDSQRQLRSQTRARDTGGWREEEEEDSWFGAPRV